jgi:hypothetical protein
MAIPLLYYGTTESVAKSAPLVGIPSTNIVLTTCYASFQAFTACFIGERWAIVEITVRKLNKGSLLPHADLQGKPWQKSLDMMGVCLHPEAIPAKAIGKIYIFNPQSNWMITRSVLHVSMGVKAHKGQHKCQEVINRWLTGEFVTLDEWLETQKEVFSKEQKDEMTELWNDRSGLDLFYHGSRTYD